MIQGPLLTPKEAARTLGVSVSTLARWRAEKSGPPWCRVGKSVRYNPRSLEAWVKERESE